MDTDGNLYWLKQEEKRIDQLEKAEESEEEEED